MLAIFTLSLTAPANKEHTQGSLVTDDYTPVPIDSEAAALMGIGQCAVWCSSNVANWNTKCGWGSGYCSACSECSDVSVPHCVYWCAMHSASWGEKCDWDAKLCSGCTDCLDASTITNESGCATWCADNGADWSTKCLWPDSKCSQCSDCGGSVQISTGYNGGVVPSPTP